MINLIKVKKFKIVIIVQNIKLIVILSKLEQ